MMVEALCWIVYNISLLIDSLGFLRTLKIYFSENVFLIIYFVAFEMCLKFKLIGELLSLDFIAVILSSWAMHYGVVK